MALFAAYDVKHSTFDLPAFDMFSNLHSEEFVNTLLKFTHWERNESQKKRQTQQEVED